MKGQRSEKAKGYKPMTVERMREFPGLENLSDQEARQVIESLERLSLIVKMYPQRLHFNPLLISHLLVHFIARGSFGNCRASRVNASGYRSSRRVVLPNN